MTLDISSISTMEEFLIEKDLINVDFNRRTNAKAILRY